MAEIVVGRKSRKGLPGSECFWLLRIYEQCVDTKKQEANHRLHLAIFGKIN